MVKVMKKFLNIIGEKLKLVGKKLSPVLRWTVTILSAPFVGTMLALYAPIALLLWGIGRLLNRKLSLVAFLKWVAGTKAYQKCFPPSVRCVFSILWKLFLVVGGLVFWVVYLLLFLIVVWRDIGPLVRSIAVPVANKMGYELTLEKLELAPLNGRISIQGLRLENAKVLVEKNPEFYKQEHAFVALGNFTFALNIWSVLTKDVHIHEIRLEGLRCLLAWDKIELEDEEYSLTNVEALLIQWGLKPIPTEENLAKAREEAREAAEEVAEEVKELEAKQEAERQKIEEAVEEGRMTREEAEELLREVGYTIDTINIEDNVITFVLPLLPSAVSPAIPVKLPPYAATHSNDRQLREKFEPVMQTLMKTYDKCEGLMEKLGDGLDVGLDALKGLTGKVGDVEAVKEVSKAVDSVVESLGEVGEVELVKDVTSAVGGVVESLGEVDTSVVIEDATKALGTVVDGLGDLGSESGKMLGNTASKLSGLLTSDKDESLSKEEKKAQKKAKKEALKGQLKSLFK